MNIHRSSHHHQFDPAWEAGGVRDDEGGGGHGEAGPAVPVHRGRGAGVEVTGLPAWGDRQTVQSAVQCQRRTRAFFLRQRKMTLTKHLIFFPWFHSHCSLDLVLPCSSGTWLLTCCAVNILYSLTGISFRSASRLPPSVSSSSNMTGTSTVPRSVWQLRWHFGKRIMFTFLYRK